ncbi:hypothetical protein GGE67_003808 [Rhizobium leucaenae]|uniref:Uncharacterized protein n=1 Tax=Rhizobium leucaenae TaxID=29450 RepID=A0A7W6ZSP7_9HYPH|nr:hypothetical protein [Rhizobium leucaenae]MBB6303182.1 hypothetical protein [Rhizobium leucaenae]
MGDMRKSYANQGPVKTGPVWLDYLHAYIQ